MSSHQDRLNDYPLFYEEIGPSRNAQTVEEAKAATAYEQPSGLNEEQLAKLSDDLRRPLEDTSSPSNPLR